VNWIFGGAGDDVISTGGAGSSEVFGDDGNDTMTGSSGSDIFLGGPGDDYVDGGGGSGDILYGDAGNDTMVGGNGDDYIYGDNYPTDPNTGSDTCTRRAVPITSRLTTALGRLRGRGRRRRRLQL
jgi:Ca2+-binding RTX toxin-like protein